MKQFLLLFLVGCGGAFFYVPPGEAGAEDASEDAGLKVNVTDGGIIVQEAEAGLMQAKDASEESCDDDDSECHEGKGKFHHGRYR